MPINQSGYVRRSPLDGVHTKYSLDVCISAIREFLTMKAHRFGCGRGYVKGNPVFPLVCPGQRVKVEDHRLPSVCIKKINAILFLSSMIFHVWAFVDKKMAVDGR